MTDAEKAAQEYILMFQFSEEPKKDLVASRRARAAFLAGWEACQKAQNQNVSNSSETPNSSTQAQQVYEQVKDLRDLRIGQAYDFIRKPGGTKVYGIVGKVSPDPDHPNWGTVYDNLGKYLVALSYGEWLEARMHPCKESDK